MRGTVAKRLRRLGLRKRREERAPLTGPALQLVLDRQAAASAPYVNARRAREQSNESE